jgi:hypothetical protein
MSLNTLLMIVFLLSVTGCQERFDNPIMLPTKDSNSLTLSTSENGTIWYDSAKDKVALWDGNSTSFLASTDDVDKAKKEAIEQAIASMPVVPAAIGVAGANGINGLNVYSGSTIPSDSNGRDEETYFDISTGDVYTKITGIWTIQGNLFIGSGLSNLSVHQGPVSPGNSYGNNGETFINSANGNLLLKSNGVWAVTGNIMGTPGATGPQGPQGAAGPQGLPGESGSTITDSQATSKILTGFSSSAGTVSDSDSILSAFGKLDGNVAGLVLGKQNSLGYSPVNKTGDTMSGALVLNANPTSALGAATRQYVDLAISSIPNPDLSPYLTISSAATTYATISSVGSSYQTLSGSTSTLALKLDTSTAAATYATIASLNTGLSTKMDASGSVAQSQVTNLTNDLSAINTSLSSKQSSLGYVPVNIAGDTMTGLLILNSNPVSALGAATRQYVDTAISTVNNVNLTGPITSIGNATSISSQTGSGSTFVMSASPTLVTPNIGSATGSSISVTGQLTSTLATGTAPFVVSSSTQVSNLNSEMAGTATNASNIATTATTTNSIFYPTFVSSSSNGNQTARTSNGLTYNPSTGALTATTFNGSATLAATAVNAFNLSGSNLTGDVSNSSNAITLTSVGTAGAYAKVTTDSKGRVISGSGLSLSDIPSLSSLYLQSSGGTLTGALITPSIKISVGSTSGYVLTSDDSGNGTWQAASGGGGGGSSLPLSGGTMTGALYTTNQINYKSKTDNAANTSTIDWSLGQVQTVSYTTCPSSITFTNMNAGGTYTLVVTASAGSATIAFSSTGTSAISDGGFKVLPDKSCSIGTQIYTFVVAGATVYMTNSGAGF